jgi:hypothetical protein
MALTDNERKSLETYENEERYLAKKLLETSSNIKEINFTRPEQRKFYDGWYIKNNETSVFFEVKCRAFSIDRYPDFIMEKKKLENLLSLVGQGKRVAYINIFTTQSPDYYSAILFDLNGRYEQWKESGIPYERRYMNSQTFVSRSNKIEKEVYMMQYDSNIDHKVDSFLAPNWK